MPMDVFKEIVRHLTPPDLLTLARSSKFLRNIFKSRSSLHLWQLAIKNVPGLPLCPTDMSALGYTSLIYSKTCSECGVRALRRMDVYLRVRLCTACRNSLVNVSHTKHAFALLLPTSPGMLGDESDDKRDTIYYLKRDFDALGATLSDSRFDDQTLFVAWKEGRQRELEERKVHAMRLDDFLRQMEIDQANKLQQLTNQRKQSIQERLFEDGWTLEDMDFPFPINSQWDRLTLQPRPLTNRIWSNLRPQLIPLLRTNRERIEAEERHNRLQKRKENLHRALQRVEYSWPLAEVVVHWGDKLNMSKFLSPFPTTAEALTWEPVKNMVEADTDIEQMNSDFSRYEEDVGLEIQKWRRVVDQDLVDIWNGPTSEVSGSPEAKVESTTSQSQENAAARPSTTTGTSLPRFTTRFYTQDGARKPSLKGLPEEQRLLLRADTVFKSTSTSLTQSTGRYYPKIVPPCVMFYSATSGSDLYFGEVWDPSKVERDDYMAGVARMLLRRIGCLDATYVELAALGNAFICERCCNFFGGGWEGLLSHYSLELFRWNKAQSALRSGSSGIVYNNTHELSLEDTRPIVQIMEPKELIELRIVQSSHLQNEDTDEMVCLACEDIGITASYYHPKTYGEGASAESAMAEHLRDVHGINEPDYLRHCRAVEGESEA
ncbi:hypothetical protein FRC06_010456 [Ceratobasidium sp. 370]|nr:hypothetical protein FRC06_010456 [Ceratobasidium sp. 370]